MDINDKLKKQKKRRYNKPCIECIKIDNDITMVMMTDPPGDPEDSIQPDHFNTNPLKIFKL